LWCGDYCDLTHDLRWNRCSVVDPEKALDFAIGIANRIAAIGSLGIKATLQAARLAINNTPDAAFVQLEVAHVSRSHSDDLIEVRKAEAENWILIVHGR
jgi:enoyl-CoA hydratase/carnithine racemase